MRYPNGSKNNLWEGLVGSLCNGQNLFSENHPNQYFGQVGQGWSGWPGWSDYVRGRFTCGWTACLPACLPACPRMVYIKRVRGGACSARHPHADRCPVLVRSSSVPLPLHDRSFSGTCPFQPLLLRFSHGATVPCTLVTIAYLFVVRF